MGKLKYMAPEILELMKKIKERTKNEKIDLKYDPEKADVFSLGILISSLCCLEMVDVFETPKDAFNKKMMKIQSAYPKLHFILVDMLTMEAEPRKNFRKVYEYISQYSKEISKFEFFELEFESALKATSESSSKELKGLEKVYSDWTKKGDFNMRNNLFGEAIMCYLKVYELIKRGEIPYKKE